MWKLSPCARAVRRASSMNAVVGGGHQRSASTIASSSANGSSSASSSARPTRQGRDRPVAMRLFGIVDPFGRGDQDVFHRRVGIATAPAGAHAGDLVDDVHTLGDATEYRVAVLAGAMVEEGVVGEIDEEL